MKVIEVSILSISLQNLYVLFNNFYIDLFKMNIYIIITNYNIKQINTTKYYY